MDVRLVRVFLLLISFTFISCGDRFNLENEAGRRARIDDANLYISNGQCQSAIDAISPLYNSGHRDEEVILVMASAYACKGGFKLLTVASNLVGVSNYFSAVAKSMPNSLGDGKITALYSAVDVLTGGSTAGLNASSRSKNVNTYMVFLQLGVMGAILNGYGTPDSSGNQVTALSYSNPRVGGEMSNLDACALAASMSFISDSYSNSNLTDADSAAANSSLNAACITAGFSSCAAINRDRTLCTGLAADSPSVDASAMVTVVNGAW